MYRFSIGSLSAFAFIAPVFTASDPAPQSSSSQLRTILHPINILDYEASIGLQRRDDSHLSGLNPQNQSQLVYGSLAGE